MESMQKRSIPKSGELLPVIGCGTYVGFDVAASDVPGTELPDVVAQLYRAGGTVLDTSPMYGRAEAAIGKLLAHHGSRSETFVATKVWTKGRAAGERQMNSSMKAMGVESVDLMQIHNLVDFNEHIKTLRSWKEQGRIRYVGATHYTSSAYDELEKVMRAEPLDFVQLNYSIADRVAERRLLPLAMEKKIAVMVNLPFGSGGLLRDLRTRPVPAWAAEYGCKTWSCLLLKFILQHAAVTCVIPGTGSSQHMAENAAAGRGPAADAAFRRQLMAEFNG